MTKSHIALVSIVLSVLALAVLAPENVSAPPTSVALAALLGMAMGVLPGIPREHKMGAGVGAMILCFAATAGNRGSNIAFAFMMGTLASVHFFGFLGTRVSAPAKEAEPPAEEPKAEPEDIRAALARLAHEQPALRKSLLPLLHEQPQDARFGVSPPTPPAPTEEPKAEPPAPAPSEPSSPRS